MASTPKATLLVDPDRYSKLDGTNLQCVIGLTIFRTQIQSRMMMCMRPSREEQASSGKETKNIETFKDDV